MTRVSTARHAGLKLALSGACLLVASCGGEAQEDARASGAAATIEPVPTQQLAVSRVSPIVPGPVLFCPPPDGTRPDPTLVNTDPFVLSRFPLGRVYKQLVSLAGASTSPTALYQQMWDSLDVNASAKFPAAPHCDDAAPPSINGFPIDCPRPETVLKNSPASSFVPVALFNRFDLAPADGLHCGEYRIVYAMRSGAAGRNFIIFEGILPNPNPKCGLEACRPVVKFWESLASHDPATAAGQTALADGLDAFYFKGLPGFLPVVHPDHYGATGGGGYGQRSGGQIRTNMFVDFKQWQLREFHLVTQCSRVSCSLVLQPVTVKTNPFHEMFNELEPAPDPRAPAFRGAFPFQAGPLANDNLNLLSMSIKDTFNAGQSTSQNPAEHYELQLQLGGLPNAFSGAIDAQLGAVGRPDLTAEDVARRATTQSCAGCHELSNNQKLGGKVNPTWPPSRRFVHVDEASFLSKALWCTFLPHRKGVLDGFAASPPRLCLDDRVLEPLIVAEPGLPLPPVEVPELTVAGKVTGPN